MENRAMAIIVVGLVVAIAAGFGAGWGLKPDASVKAIQAQTESIEALQAGQKEILAEAQKPVLLDAAIRATLTEIPPQCVAEMGGDPMSAQCAWAYCVRTGQSNAQRCQDVQFTATVLDSIKAHDAAKAAKESQ
jgi:hypothetical protein